MHLVPARLQKRHFGDVVSPGQRRLLHRENIYGSGPPVLEPGVQMLRLILDYLSPRSSVLDVGCGAGVYGPALITAGHQWTGLEVNPDCWRLLEQRGLPFCKIAPGTERFPCADEEFDEAICIEVLEHIEYPEPFLEEISRIVRQGRFSRCRTSRSFPISRIGKLCPGICWRATTRIFSPAQVFANSSLPISRA